MSVKIIELHYIYRFLFFVDNSLFLLSKESLSSSVVDNFDVLYLDLYRGRHRLVCHSTLPFALSYLLPETGETPQQHNPWDFLSI